MHSYFKQASDEERGHAMKLLKYLNKRGGRIILQDIKAPEAPGEMTALEAMTKALDFEKKVNEVRSANVEDYSLSFVYFQNLFEVHRIASSHNDEHMCDFIATEFLTEQVESIKEFADHVTNLQRVGDGLGVYMFDQNLMNQKE